MDKPGHGNHPIEWDGDVIGVLVHGQEGDYVVPPVVFNPAGQLILGQDVLAAVVESGVTNEHPVLRNFSEERLPELEARLDHVRRTLGLSEDTA